VSDDAGAGDTPRAGLREALGRLADGGLAVLRTRAELATLELAEERDRLVKRIALLVGGVLLLAFGAMYVGAFVVVMFWDSNRLLAIALVGLAHLGIGAWLVMLAKGLGVGITPFEATLAEIEKDRESISRALRPFPVPRPVDGDDSGSAARRQPRDD